MLPHDWTIAGIAIAVVAIAAIFALVLVALKRFKITVPEWVIEVFWIILVGIVVIAAIKFVASFGHWTP